MIYTDYVNKVIDDIVKVVDGLEKSSGHTIEELIDLFSKGYKLTPPGKEQRVPFSCNDRCSTCKHFRWDSNWDGFEEVDELHCNMNNDDHIGWGQIPCCDYEIRQGAD